MTFRAYSAWPAWTALGLAQIRIWRQMGRKGEVGGIVRTWFTETLASTGQARPRGRESQLPHVCGEQKPIFQLQRLRIKEFKEFVWDVPQAVSAGSMPREGEGVLLLLPTWTLLAVLDSTLENWLTM